MTKTPCGGVRPQDDGYIIDYTRSCPEDIVHIYTEKLYRADHKGRVYWFGYEFCPGTTPAQRTEFIHYIKELGAHKIPAPKLRRFIEYPLNELDKKINLYSIDCFVYPLSGRSPLVQKMIEAINEYTANEIHRASFELVKSAPVDVEFDWERFESEVLPDTNRYAQMCAYVNERLLPAIRELDYFSLAASVKPPYRRYIKNFLGFQEGDAERFGRLKGQKILIVDDINTSGATLNEIIRILKKVNPTCEIFIYTLIGNFPTTEKTDTLT